LSDILINAKGSKRHFSSKCYSADHLVDCHSAQCHFVKRHVILLIVRPACALLLSVYRVILEHVILLSVVQLNVITSLLSAMTIL